MDYTNKLLANILDTLITQIEEDTLTCNNCVHKWIYDLIDINPDKSISIYYCFNCQLTKK